MRSRKSFVISGALLLAGWALSFAFPNGYVATLSLISFVIAALAATIGLFISQHQALTILLNTCIAGTLLTGTFFAQGDANLRMSMTKYGHCFQRFDDRSNRDGLAELYRSRGIDETVTPESFVFDDFTSTGEPMREWSYKYKTIDGKYEGLARGDGCGLMEAWP